MPAPLPAPEAAYLAAERAAPTRSEYLAGQVLPLAPASAAHARLAQNVASLLRQQAQDHAGYLVLGSEMRLYVPEGPLYTYPDATLVCGPAQLLPDGHHDTLLNPTLLVKIVPHALPAHFQQVAELYYAIPTVQHVVLVTEYAARVSLGSRTAQGLLHVYGFTGLGEVVLLPDLGIELPLADLYRNVPLAG